ncbi:MAG: hypothetical protein ACRDJ3_09280 [Solirubrobacteraceae bacterium]
MKKIGVFTASTGALAGMLCALALAAGAQPAAHSSACTFGKEA